MRFLISCVIINNHLTIDSVHTMNTSNQTLDIDINEIVNKVLDLRELWISRSKDYPFYTLGKSAYLDGKTHFYYRDSAWLNEILLGDFSELYEVVLDYLSEQYEERVVLAHDLAIPGFHIFPSDPKFLTIAGKWHMDLPHTTLDLGDKDPSAFTVPIKMPVSGGGMDWLDEKGTIRHIPYKEREIVLHTGLDVHRIASMKSYTPGEYRITLQGHLIRRNNTMEVFW